MNRLRSRRSAEGESSRHAERKTDPRAGRRALILFFAGLFLLCAAALTWRYLHPTPEAGVLAVRFLDVGEGDAAFLLTEDGGVLIDTGPASARAAVEQSLRPWRAYLRWMILTHAHADHTGSALALLRRYRPELLILPFTARTEAEYQPFLDEAEAVGAAVLFAEAGHSFSLGGAIFTVLAPLTDAEALNNDSLVLRVDYGAVSFLFTGDAERESEEAQLAAFGSEVGGLLDTDVLKAAHHGSSTSTSDGYLRAVTPSCVILSVGENTYGHPSPALLSRLAEEGIAVLRTDLSGTLLMKTDGVTVTVGPP